MQQEALLHGPMQPMQIGCHHLTAEMTPITCLQPLVSDLNNMGTLLYERGENDVALDLYQTACVTLILAMKPLTELKGLTRDLEEAYRRIEDKSRLGRGKLSESFESQTGDHRPQCQAGSTSFHQTRSISRAFYLQASANMTHDDVGCRHNLAAIMYNMGLVYNSMGYADEALKQFRATLESMTNEAEESSHCEAVAMSALNNCGHIHFNCGRLEEAMKDFSEALRLGQKAACRKRIQKSDSSGNSLSGCGTPLIDDNFAKVVTNHAIAMFAVADTCEQQGIFSEAMMFYVRILEMRDKLTEIKDTHRSFVYSQVLHRIGNIHYKRGDRMKAIQAYEFSLTLRKEALGVVNPEVASLVYDIGIVQLEVGMIREGLSSFKACLDSRRGYLGNDDGEVGEVLYRIGSVYQDLGEYQEALNAYMETVRIEKMVLGIDHPDVAITLTNIAEIHCLCGHPELGLRIYHEVLGMAKKCMGETHPSTIELHVVIGNIHLSRGGLSEAMTAFAEARSIADGARQESGSSEIDISSMECALVMSMATMASGAPAA